MGDKLLFIVIVTALLFFSKQWMIKRRREKGIPIFSVKPAWQKELNQPILKTTAVFGYKRGEQDWLLVEKYYKGRKVAAKRRKYRVDCLRKIPAGKFRKTCYYRIYFQEYYMEEFPRRMMICGHVRYWKCIFHKEGVIFYDYMEQKRLVMYDNVMIVPGKRKFTLALVTTRKKLTVFHDYNFNYGDFMLMQEIFIKYGKLGFVKKRHSGKSLL